ncbi:uncharacterized protein LOC123690116 [Pieris rapae]|uniref:uncharacterized protein LOC123690116 n=1 Tax=Pieris rapae TaxID=64459 RepID=UPI001E27C10F|nr:uncharacterized protein LOC123690116 [Pieris rapae]
MDLVDRLQLRIFPASGSIFGVGGSKVAGLRGQVTLTFSPVQCSQPQITISAIILDNVMGRHPLVKLPSEILDFTRSLNLADCTFHIPGQIDLLLGAEVLGRLRLSKSTLLQPAGLVAVTTDFGDVIMGPVFPIESLSVEDGNLCVGLSLAEAIQRFWEVEEPPTAARENPEHQECELFFQNNTGRLRSGRFVTRLPFLPSRPPLGHSRSLAEKRLTSMERRMKRDSTFRAKYIEFMDEYFKLGHMSVSDYDWRTQEHYFIPHHAVFKGGKIRVVFDGSAPTSNGVSLNQCLHSGPRLHRDIGDILTNFRRHQIVFVADIKMMFRQTVIHTDDRCYQLILWREKESDPVTVFELNTNTYGLRSSPYIAIRTLLELAERERLQFPRAADVLNSDVFVDDICTGAANEKEALILRDELIGILKAGGYELRKWVSNSQAVLAGLPEDHQQHPYIFQNVDNPDAVAVLGIQYQPLGDIFTFRVQDIDVIKSWTKRVVLSTVAKIYDPNGWLAPVVFWAKCFIQKLWLQGLTWDAPLVGELLSVWIRFVSSLPEIQLIKIDRSLLPPGKCIVDIHGFCDASESGYAAAVYIRSVNQSGVVTVKLVMAKSKVAPVRTRLTIPKLELSGAVLLTRLINHVKSIFGQKMNIQKCFAWTDSQIVLAWLQASVHVLEVFVANRVCQIQQSVVTLDWRHVPGEFNPADCASRGCEAPVILDHPLWWAPGWLYQPENCWPRIKTELVEPLPGLRVISLVVQESIENLDPLLARFSSLDKLIGVTAWIRRFIYNSRNPTIKNMSNVLSPDERNESLLFWVRYIQAKHFETVFATLKGQGKLKGSVARLNPFIDDKGLLRVGGRLRHSELPYNHKHPLLLPNRTPLGDLIITDRHEKNAHVGLNTLLAIIHQQFWILSARRAIRNVIFKCIPCYRLKASLTQPQMGDLPPDRITAARPFSGVGTDFAGPFSIKVSSLRNAKIVKGYLCVFVCLVTKSVHLEVVSSLSTEAFIACLSRFVSRRGLPNLIRSDCGTNFKGSERYLGEVYKFLTENQLPIESSLSRRGIKWKFSPAGYPSWGGIFEAVVKVAKTHIRRIIGESVLTYEELATVFCNIESVLNSRPLCPISSDPNDLEALTPGHFLIGAPLNALPEYPFVDTPINRLSRFQLLQQLSQSFWKRFNIEYLHLLQQRVRWIDKTDPPKVGDLVLIKEPNMPPLSWRRGRIIKLFPGADGTPRVAEVRVGESVLKRAVACLSRLPVA